MRNFTPFLLISGAVTFCFLFSLGCGPTIDYAKIFNDLGIEKVKIKQYEEAIAYFDTAVESQPDFAEAYYNRGNAKVKLAEFKMANDDYHEVIKLDFSGKMVKLYLDAKTDFETALKLAEQAGDTHLKAKIELKLRETPFDKLPPNGKEPQPDKIFRVGDKLPSFTYNDVADSSNNMTIVGRDAAFGFGSFDGIYWVGGILTVQGVKYGTSVIAISDKMAWIELKDGTRYVCLTDGGCIISQEDYIIIRGEIKVSYKNGNK